MKTQEQQSVITWTSPAAASTVVVADSFKGSWFKRADLFVVDAVLRGATGGVLDVYLQRRTGADDWTDWVHFPQLSAAQAVTRYTFALATVAAPSIVVCGGGTTAAPGVALAANTVVNVQPGDEVRIVCVAGASTSAGAAQTITITPYSDRK